ncbi:bifunctional proline dehydrogenase/L-glutamate gamma-semialdehyde dehydrogenase [Rhodopirellula sp. MGV]|uniref:bifunctional proline dehydrogenase/L-glutamate gamma-semialdehyde dehydrogenase n=1 Tax=Rhodopirellula sp. MGV TaxID=2023130 RepID=UPI000B9784DD|nr:bifunctional proline dehydrogenase/L-glutamate gamma-semialdehyde dehydrogenase [Rhodopirellula sp. MGV]OYP35742.1 proline dehydrogenase [Rhodopirellula sp. MGV]PNY33674.1 proline dehydrogenase [Rhodopirellula baltica]
MPVAQPLLDLEELLSIAEEHDNDADASIAMAKALLIRSHELQSPQEQRQQAEFSRMIQHPEDKATLVEMTDQAFRTHSSARVADQLTHLLDLQGIPRFFSPLEQTMLRGFQTFGGYLPGVAVPMVKDKMRHETANVILPAEDKRLREHLNARQESGVLMNLNFLGEALLGEEEAERRLHHYLHALQMPEIACISVKLSTVYSQVSTIAREHTVRMVADRMELLYRAAIRQRFIVNGKEMPKFVYLDMEEYRDLHLTADVFRKALSRPGLEQARAGIALQAYVPDSYGVLADLIAWSAERVKAGGRPITVRLVKGANMEMERVEASQAGLPQTPFDKKVDTDANFKRMLRLLIEAAGCGYVRIGVASHNLFDISLALLWGARTKRVDDENAFRPGSFQPDETLTGTALDYMQFEMLEGMANHQRRALFESTPRMLLYAPACKREDFLNAIGYLIRRLDENTGPENFLRYSFHLSPTSSTWVALADGFRSALDRIDEIDTNPRRLQNRFESVQQPPAADHWSNYINEPDTDWSLPRHSDWAKSIVETWSNKSEQEIEVPLKIGGEVRDSNESRPQRESFDPSRPEVVSCRFTMATGQDVDDAITIAHEDPDGWRSTTWEHRYGLLRAAAQLMRERRGDLIGSMMLDGGKLITEADPEVSEAIDFTEFYPLTAKEYLQRDNLNCRPRGTVAVISPWNFPLAIPCGGIASALAAGNTVILKPASDTVLPAYEIAKCFWDAGVSPNVLQVIPCSGAGAGSRLVSDERIDAVVLTGGTETAKEMLRLRPDLHLIAETGGKNATIVSAMCDRDLAIKHVLHSAFSHGGQKCSATSLLLLDQELYEDKEFRSALADAAKSLTVGSAWKLNSRLGPLIRPPSGELEQGIKELESGEEWLVRPRLVDENPQLYTPGIKWNVCPGSFTHSTELFGPVLGVMKYAKLEQAIEMVASTGYGLTSGLESLDDREQELWREAIPAGNLYINRPTTGAIVLRQPFGGIGKSAYGPGAKAGGPHYVLPLMHVESSATPIDESKIASTERLPQIDSVLSAVESVVEEDQLAIDRTRIERFARLATHWAATTLDQTHDHVKLIGQDNLRRYRAPHQLRVRLTGEETTTEIALSMLAAAAANCHATYSMNPNDTNRGLIEHTALSLARFGKSDWRIEWIEESEAALASSVSDGRVDRLRLLRPERPLSDELFEACRSAFVTILAESVVDDPEVETFRYVLEQSISYDFHRYGNLGRRPLLEAAEKTKS